MKSTILSLCASALLWASTCYAFEPTAFWAKARPLDQGMCETETQQFPCVLAEFDGKDYLVLFVVYRGSLVPGFIVEKESEKVVWTNPLIQQTF